MSGSGVAWRRHLGLPPRTRRRSPASEASGECSRGQSGDGAVALHAVVPCPGRPQHGSGHAQAVYGVPSSRALNKALWERVVEYMSWHCMGWQDRTLISPSSSRPPQGCQPCSWRYALSTYTQSWRHPSARTLGRGWGTLAVLMGCWWTPSSRLSCRRRAPYLVGASWVTNRSALTSCYRGRGSGC